MNKEEIETLTQKLVVGARIKIGEHYEKGIGGLKAGDIITLIEGHFEGDNGLYTYDIVCPAIKSQEDEDFDDYDSIYHLFGNNFEYFADCEVLTNT